VDLSRITAVLWAFCTGLCGPNAGLSESPIGGFE